MREKYDPTVKLGDQRWRPLKQTVVSPNNGIPSVEIKDEIVILAEDKNGDLVEEHFKDAQAFSVNIVPEIMPTEIPEIGLDYQPTGRMITIAQAFSGYATFIRWAQRERDAAEQANALPKE
jgi:hypothetical protein